jgi:biopolymer transport protein ExbB/TolQ
MAGLIKFFQDGGLHMLPIALAFAAGLAIAIERWIFLTRERSRNTAVWNALQPALNAGDFKRANDIAQQSSAELGKMIVYCMSRIGRRAEDLELALEEGLMEIMPKLEKRTGYLSMLANVATLLGLLGTIMGLIDAFGAVATAAASEKAALLSAAIAVAMNATAFGLVAAIPLLMASSYLQSQTSEIVDSLEMAAVKFSNFVRKVQVEKEMAQARAAQQPPRS